jgi:succinate dehydrogenase / fumarate reductase membrane anchor subunit
MIMPADDTRSPLARATGLGSAKSGIEDWAMERVSAVALVPLTVWFIVGILTHAGGGYAGYYAWLHALSTAILMVLLLLAIFHHAALGLQVIVEDYVHSGIKFAVLMIVRFGCIALAVSGIIAVLRISWPG